MKAEVGGQRSEVSDQKSDVGTKPAMGQATKLEWLQEAKRLQDLAVRFIEIADLDSWPVTQAHGAAVNAQTLLQRALAVLEARQTNETPP